MKKSMSFIAAIAMAATMVSAIPASAAEVTIDKSVVLKKEVTESYVVTIPDSPETWEEATNLQIDVTKAVIASKSTLNVKVGSVNYDDAWNIVNDDDAIAYNLTKDDVAVDPDDAILSVEANKTGSVTLVATPPSMEAAKYAGEYTDTLTFTVDIAAAQQTPPASQGD